MAGAKDEVADRLAIRRFPGKQVLRRFGLRAKIVADKIGDPLGAGKIQIVFRAKIIGDSGDILPGLGGDIAGSQWELPGSDYFGATKTWEHLGEVQSEVVRFAVRFPSDKEQSSLLIDADAPVYDFVRLRLLNGEPVSLDLTVMPVGLVPGLTKSHLEGSVFRYVQETLGLKLMGSYRVVRAMKPGELDKQHLHCEPTDPVLEVEQVIYLEDGTPLEYAHCHYRYDHGGIILVNNG